MDNSKQVKRLNQQRMGMDKVVNTIWIIKINQEGMVDIAPISSKLVHRMEQLGNQYSVVMAEDSNFF